MDLPYSCFAIYTISLMDVHAQGIQNRTAPPEEIFKTGVFTTEGPQNLTYTVAVIKKSNTDNQTTNETAYRNMTEGVLTKPISGLNDTIGFNRSTASNTVTQTPKLSAKPAANLCKLYDQIVAFTIAVITFFGIFGNILSILTLSKMNMSSANSLMLSALAVCDTVFLLLGFLLKTVPVIFVDFLKMNVTVFYDAFIYVIVYGWSAVTVVYSIGTWVTVLVTLQRFIAVCLPHHALSYCGASLARKQLFLVIVFNVLYSLPLFLDSYVKRVYSEKYELWYNTRVYSWLGRNWSYQFAYRTVLYFLLMYSIPLLMLLVMVVKLIRALKLANRKRSQMTGNVEAKDDLTKILIVLVLVFVTSQVSTLITLEKVSKKNISLLLMSYTSLLPMALLYSKYITYTLSEITQHEKCYC